MTIFAIEASKLNNALKLVKSATISKTDSQANNIQVSIEDETLTVTAYNYDSFISKTIDMPCAIENITFVSSYTLLANIVAVLSGEITIEVTKTLIKLSESDNVFKLPRMPQDSILDVPSDLVSSIEGCTSYQFLDSDSLAILDLASKRASTELSKGVLTSVYASGSKVAATDSFRLIEIDYSNHSFDETLLIPANFLINLPKQALKHEWMLGKSDNYIFVCDSDKTLKYASIITQGDYPNYPALVPTKFEYEVFGINKALFLANLNKVATLSERSLVEISFTEASLVLTTEGYGGDCKVEMDLPCHVEGLNESTPAYSFNLGYLNTAVKDCKSEEFTLLLNQSNQPVLVTNEYETSQGNASTIELLMPCMIRR